MKVSKVVYQDKKKSFDERWGKLQEAKLLMKENLYTYNNIVKVKRLVQHYWYCPSNLRINKGEWLMSLVR